MSNVPLPNIGQALRIRMTEDSKDYYNSRLIESGENELYIDAPLHAADRTVAPVTSQVWVEFHAMDGALCRFQAKLLSTQRMPALAWRIARPKVSEVIREQRREFVRVPCDLAVRLEYASESGRQRAEVHARDISGGGMLVWLPKNVILRTGAVVGAKFTLTNTGFPVDVKCFVVRVGERNEFGAGPCSLQFLELKESVRQRIIQYTFWRQRNLK